MIKRLRLKFMCISMVLVTVLLSAIMILICHFTWEDMDERTLNTLQSFDVDRMEHGEPMPDMPDKPDKPDKPGGPVGPDRHGETAVLPEIRDCFVLSLDPQGNLVISESSQYDLSDTKLLQEIFEAACSNGNPDGILFRYSLRFYRAEGGTLARYVFLDISSEMSTMRALILSCTAIGGIAFLLFFVLMLALSKWMVGPVEEAWNRQRQFVADASHELKTPLTVILTNAELLQSEEYDHQTKGRFVHSIHTMSVQMRGLVEGLLELARVDNGGARRQMGTVDLSRLAEETTLAFEVLYFEAERTLESSIAPGLSVHGSEAHLRQVVEILLDNGRKYAKPGTTVCLKLSRQGHSRVQLRVTSQGERLTSQQCKDIFKRFYRVDEARAMNHSYGLGLSIAQSIVAEHKGRIWCESVEGTNTFYVNLPLHH